MEQHSAMRYAWLRKKEGLDEPPMSAGERVALIAYNAVWWLPVILVVLGVWSYRSGAIAFVLITFARALINLYRNNLLSDEAAQRFPLRLP